jgi:hypothetical protein
MTAHYEIQKGVPLPEQRRGRPPVYPFKNMQPGDSFTSPRYVNLKRINFPEGSAFICRKVVENGVTLYRTWRLR